MQENAYFCSQFESYLKKKTVKTKSNACRLQVLAVALVAAAAACALSSCGGKQAERVEAPWGVVNDSTDVADGFDLDRIQANGEMIMLALGGPESYYDYRGRHLGLQYMLCQRFADHIGVSLRVEVCRDTAEMLRRLAADDGDVAACFVADAEVAAAAASEPRLVSCTVGVDSAAAHWVVTSAKPRLAEAIDGWYRPGMIAAVRREEALLLSSAGVRHRVYSPMLNRKEGIISRYDALFMTYCQPIRWDWRLMAAQCYQESTFDPAARSWAGACGLMQIMPSTAAQLGLPADGLFDPESNIAAAARFLGQLERKFSDIADRGERLRFVLASYNGGYHHIRDAMALAGRDGHNQHRWADVSRYVLLLSTPRYYQDPIVKYGYMRGSETVDYVQKIYRRWESYRGVKGGRDGFTGTTPRKATHRKKKYEI